MKLGEWKKQWWSSKIIFFLKNEKIHCFFSQLPLSCLFFRWIPICCQEMSQLREAYAPFRWSLVLWDSFPGGLTDGLMDWCWLMLSREQQLEIQYTPFWSNYSDLTRPHLKWWWKVGENPLISGKPRSVKYFSHLASGPLIGYWLSRCWFHIFFFSHSRLEMIQFWLAHIFQMGWVEKPPAGYENSSLGICYLWRIVYLKCISGWREIDDVGTWLPSFCLLGNC